jgi:adenylylsulfate kinase-like enzyme
MIVSLIGLSGAGVIPLFTEIDSPYEPPLSPEIEISTQQLSVDEAVTLFKHSLDEFRKNS